jgi:predicted Zn-dependent protease
MKYSKNAASMRLREAKDYVGAIESLRACINEARGDRYEAVLHADLLQRIGDLQLEQGLREAAFESHALALKTDPASLLARLQFAKLLARAGERQRAIAECVSILKTIEETPFDESEDDFGSDYYAREAKRLREALL